MMQAGFFISQVAFFYAFSHIFFSRPGTLIPHHQQRTGTLPMKFAKPLFFLILCCAPVSAMFAQQITGRFSTSVYGWERYDSLGSSRQVMRGFQMLQLEASSGDISFQTSMSGASDLNQSFGDEAAVRVSNAFLRWSRIGGAADLSLGRVPVFAGVGIGAVDGGLVKVRLADNRLSLVGFGGANVMPDLRSKGFTDLDKNFFLGGQVIAYPTDDLRASASYSSRRIQQESYTTTRPDSLFNPVLTTIYPEPRSEQLLGFDASYLTTGKCNLYGRYDYDLDTKRSIRAELSGKVPVADNLSVTGSFTYREPHVWYHTFFAILPFSPNREYEGGLEYTICPSMSVFGRFGYVQYDGDMSRRVSIGLNGTYASLRWSGGNGYSGELNSVSAEGRYPLLEGQITPTLGISFSRYRWGTEDQSNATAGSIGAIYRPMPEFSIDAQAQVMNNAEMKSDVRGFGRISYWFTHSFAQNQQKGAGQ
jgi:hypothetical protein